MSKQKILLIVVVVILAVSLVANVFLVYTNMQLQNEFNALSITYDDLVIERDGLEAEDSRCLQRESLTFRLRRAVDEFRISALNRSRRILYIVVKKKFMGMRAKLDVVDLIFNLVFNPCIDNVLGKYIPFKQKGMVLLQCIERFF